MRCIITSFQADWRLQLHPAARRKRLLLLTSDKCPKQIRRKPACIDIVRLQGQIKHVKLNANPDRRLGRTKYLLVYRVPLPRL